MIRLKMRDLDEVAEHAPAGSKDVDLRKVDKRQAHLAAVLYQSTWGHNGAFTGLPEGHRKALAQTLREVADLMDPAQ